MDKITDELISQFVKATKDEKETKNETSVSGVVAIRDGKLFVKLDGSELLTPASTTTNVKDGERVIVMIKNHSAIITGNTTSPSASTGDVEEVIAAVMAVKELVAGSVSTEELAAEKARIDKLEASNVTINETLTANSASIKTLEADNVTIKKSLTATEASITTLEADNVIINKNLSANSASIKTLETQNATITGELEANKASIETLEADNVTINKTLSANSASIKTLEADNVTINRNLSALEAEIRKITASEITTEYLEANYANIALTNIDVATIGTLFANVGLIDRATIVEGHITGFLDAVEVNANKITAGTLSVDRLIFRGGKESIVYELNNITGALQAVQGNTLNGEVLTDRSITVNKIVANSITANEIAANAITANEIAANAVISAKIATNAITADKIAAGAITATKIAAESITSEKLSVDNLSAITANMGEVSAGILRSTDYVENVSGMMINLDDGYIWAKSEEKIALLSNAKDYNGAWAITSYGIIDNQTITIDADGYIKYNSLKISDGEMFFDDTYALGIMRGSIHSPKINTESLYCAGSIVSKTATIGGTNVGQSIINLNTAVKTINTNLGQSTAGKFILPNGLKICWGDAPTTNMNGYYRRADVFFPVVYNNPPLVLTGKGISSLSYLEANITTGTGAITTTNMNVYVADTGGGLAEVDVYIKWIAIGY